MPGSPENVIKILIADDHQMFIDGIKSMLRKQKDLHIVAEANDGKPALEILRNQEIDLLISDINMPEMSGTELTKIVKSELPHVKVLVLTMYNDREIISEIVTAEAEGYILKNTGRAELIEAITKIMDHGTFYSNEVVDIMMQEVRKAKEIEENTKSLTTREKEILQLVAQEHSTVQIADKLFISPRTVDTHRKHILQKTNSKTIVGLIKFAIENELV